VIQKNGTVIEVFIPSECEYNMGSKQIGFRIKLDDDEVTIIEEQNPYNSKILKGDLVTVIKQNVSNREFLDIELYDGDDYE